MPDAVPRPQHSTFDPQSVERFRFLSYDYDERTATASLRYGFDTGVRFEERFVFRDAPPLDEPRRAALDRCLAGLHLAAGVSYYKAAVPPRIEVESGPLDAATGRFFDKLYRHGLGEFAYRNVLELEGRIRFPVAAGAGPSAAPPLRLPRRVAVPVGGGKDSVVAIEALKRLGEPMILIAVGDYAPIRAATEVAGLPRIAIDRRVAPELLELNQRGAYNGHVPVSAIYSFVLAAAAVIYGFDSVAMANERSADAPDASWRGVSVNHEYSKSLEYEADFGTLLETWLLPSLVYFSLLRPFSELSIAGLFSRERAYLPVFRSCNAAFRLAADARPASWCGECSKCRFVFLALAPFVSRAELGAIFGREPLTEAAAEGDYAALLGLTEVRPWECVGEADESLAALALVAVSREWREEPLVRRLVERAGARLDDAAGLVAGVLTPASRHRVPERFAPALEELLERAREDRDRLAGRAAPRRAAGDG